MGSRKTITFLPYLPIFAIFVSMLVWLLSSDMEHVLPRIPDDAAYYFKVAENMKSGKGATFDGIHATNGFQPLWQWILVPVAALVSGSPETMTRVYIAIQLLMLLAAALVLYRQHGRVFSPVVGLFSASLFAILTFFQSATGMESALFVLMLVLSWRFAERRRVFDGDDKNSSFAFGVLLGVTVLARLDVVFLVVASATLCLVRRRDREGLLHAIWMVCGSAVVLLPYLVYNQVAFGNIMPISGILKSSFPHLTFRASKMAFVGSMHLSFVILALLYLAWALVRARSYADTETRGRYFAGGMTVLAATVVMHFVHTMLFIRWGIFRWHFIPYALFASLVVSEPAAFMVERLRRAGSGLVLTGALLSAAFGCTLVYSRTFGVEPARAWKVASYRAAVWARDHTRGDDVFAMKDAGTFGFFSGRAVVNMDGVVSNQAYQDSIDASAVGGFLRASGVRYIVQHDIQTNDEHLLPEVRGGKQSVQDGDYDRVSFRYHSIRSGKYGEPIVLLRDAEVYRSTYGAQGEKSFVIWRYTP